MFPEIPAVAEIVVSLDELNAVAAGEGQFIGAARDEVICVKKAGLAGFNLIASSPVVKVDNEGSGRHHRHRAAAVASCHCASIQRTGSASGNPADGLGGELTDDQENLAFLGPRLGLIWQW